MAHPGPSPALQDSRAPLPSPTGQPQLDPQTADMPLTSAHLRTSSAPHITSHASHVASGRLDTMYRPHVAPYEPQHHRSHSHGHSHSSLTSHVSHTGPAGPTGHAHVQHQHQHGKHQLPPHLSGSAGVTATTESAGTTASMSTLSGPSYDMCSSSPAGATPAPVARSASAPGGAASGHYLLPHGISASAAPATATLHRTVDSYVLGSGNGEYPPRVMHVPSVPDGLATPMGAVATGAPRQPHMVGAGSVSEPLTPWHLRMEAKVDRLTSEIVQLRRMLLNSMMQSGKPMGLSDGHMAHHMRGGLVHHAIVGAAPAVHAHSTPSSGHSTSDKIDARRRRYPGFRGVPICACCNKSFCLIFNSPGGKCKRGDQCEHAHHYMPPNAPTGSIVRPLPVPASFK